MEQKIVSLVDEPKKEKRRYIKELKDELRKISWTSREDLIRSTQIVVGSTFVFGLSIYVVDLIIRGFLDWLHIFIHKMVG